MPIVLSERRPTRTLRWWSLALLSLLSLGSWGGTAAEAVLLIRGATLFDGTGREPYVADVLIGDGKILAVATGLDAPAGAKVVDARGQALLPGLLDLHTHWTASGTPGTLPQIAAAYLADGVTTVNNFNEAPEAYAPQRAWLAGMAAPSVRFTARLSTPLGHGADWADEATTRWVNSPEAARQAVRAVAVYKPDLVKAFTDGWRYNNAADNSSMDEATLAALVDEAHKHSLRVYTHTVTVARGKQAARAGVDVIAHSLLDAPVDDELIGLMRQHDTFYVPTLAVYEPLKPGQRLPATGAEQVLKQRQANFAHALANVLRLYRAGIPVALGSDAGMPGTPHAASTLRELELLVRAGLSPAQALQVGTANSARAAGLSDRGSIVVGKRADLLLVDGAPWRDIADIHNTRRVYVAGVQVVGPGSRRRSLPPQPVPALVDDFERADGRTALDTLRTDEADGGNDRSVQVTEVIDREQQGHALSLQARLSYKPAPYASVVLPLTRGSVAPAELKPYRGLRFDIRGGAGTLRVEARGLDGRRWIAEVPASAQWRTVEVPFSKLVGQPPSRTEGPLPEWRGDDVQQFVFAASGEAGAKVWFQLDNVRLY